MSLETLIAENTAAVKALTEVSQNLLALRSAAIDEIKGAAASTKAPAKTTKKTEEVPASDAGAAGAADSSASTTAAASGDATNRLKEVQEVCAAYAGGTDREEERTARKEKLTWLFGKVGAKKLAEIPAGKEAAVIKAVKQLIADGDLTQPPAADGAAADDDLLSA